jgi:hypothetical protein
VEGVLRDLVAHCPKPAAGAEIAFSLLESFPAANLLKHDGASLRVIYARDDLVGRAAGTLESAASRAEPAGPAALFVWTSDGRLVDRSDWWVSRTQRACDADRTR